MPLESKKGQVKLICYDEDSLVNDLVGEISIPVTALCGGIDEWVDFKYQGKVSAQIYIRSS